MMDDEGRYTMITIVIKQPDQAPFEEQRDNLSTLTEILDGEYEMTTDDELEGIALLVNEEVRGVRPNNFTIKTDGFHDWVYGNCVFIGIEGNSFQSLTADQVEQVKQYFSPK
jgi:hypothetical protein